MQEKKEKRRREGIPVEGKRVSKSELEEKWRKVVVEEEIKVNKKKYSRSEGKY